MPINTKLITKMGMIMVVILKSSAPSSPSAVQQRLRDHHVADGCSTGNVVMLMMLMMMTTMMAVMMATTIKAVITAVAMEETTDVEYNDDTNGAVQEKVYGTDDNTDSGAAVNDYDDYHGGRHGDGSDDPDAGSIDTDSCHRGRSLMLVMVVDLIQVVVLTLMMVLMTATCAGCAPGTCPDWGGTELVCLGIIAVTGVPH